MKPPTQTTNLTMKNRSFSKERLERINQDPYDIPKRPPNRFPSLSSQNILNFVTDKVQGAITRLKSLKKFIEPNEPDREIITLSVSPRVPVILPEKLNNLSTTIQEVISKPEYQKHYNLESQNVTTPSKANFVNVLNYYKDITAEKMEESMREKDSFIVPSLQCDIKPTPLYKRKNTHHKTLVSKPKYSKEGSFNSASQNRSELKRTFSIESTKEIQLLNKKKMRCLPELKSSSSIIKYHSSEEEDNNLLYMEEITQKKVFTEDRKVIRKEKALKLSSSKKIKLNPYQIKNLREKGSSSKVLQAEKAGKKIPAAEFTTGKKFNPENSDNLINDSKLETDSDESNLQFNTYGSPKAQVWKGQKGQKKYDNYSEESGSQKSNKASEEKLEINKPEFPMSDNVEIEEEGQEVVGEKKAEQKEVPIVEKKPEVMELPSQKETVPKSSLFSNISPANQGGLKLNTPGEKSSMNAPKVIEGSEEPQKKPTSSLFNNNNISSLFKGNVTPIESNVNPVVNKTSEQEPEKVKEISLGALEKPKQEQGEIKPIEEKVEPPAPLGKFTITEEALKNPIFSNVKLLSKPPIDESNPFLSLSKPKPLDLGSIISGGGAAANQFQEPQKQEQNLENTFLNKNSNQMGNPPSSKPLGILDLLSSKPSAPETSGLFTNTLTPAGSLSWLSSNTQDTNKTGLFSNLNNNSTFQQSGLNNNSLFQQSGQGVQSSFFNNNNTTTNNDMTFGGGNALGSSGNSLFNNNNSSMGSGSGSGSGLYQSSGSGLFGASTLNSNAGGGMGMVSGSSSLYGGGGGMNSFNNQSNIDESNPFLSRMGSTSGGGGYSLGSGKKKDTRARAF